MKVPVFCSLIPAELIVDMGHEPFMVEPSLFKKSAGYHCSFHENLCSYAKVIFDYLVAEQEKFGLIVIPTACDAMKKLHNALKKEIPAEKLFLLDVPRVKNDAASAFLAGEFKRLRTELFQHETHSPVFVKADECEPDLNTLKIGILGSNVPLNVIESSIKNHGFSPVYLNHCLTKARPSRELSVLLDVSGVEAYAGAFLAANSCPRTSDTTYKEKILKRIYEEDIVGCVVNSLKFCDFHSFDYKYFKKELGEEYPLMLIEHDLTSNIEGQVMTRIEAFLERIRKQMGLSRPQELRHEVSGRYFVGIDSGSNATKMVCIDREMNIIARELVPTGTSVKTSAEILLAKLDELHNVKSIDVGRIVATGYGRNNIPYADQVVTEITCHALGAHYVLGSAGTIIDIGGQDSKAIRIDKNGSVVRFAMNDKCAAGTGRFLEVIADRLNMTLEEFAELAMQARGTTQISSMCSVFAESEVISLIAAGESKDQIAKGIHRAIAERTIALAKRVEGQPPYYMAGGVAKNEGLVRELENYLGEPVKVIEYPQFSGALGAAIMALKG